MQWVLVVIPIQITYFCVCGVCVCDRRDKLTMLISKKDAPTDRIFVFFADSEDKKKKIGVNPIRQYVANRLMCAWRCACSRVVTGCGCHSFRFIERMEREKVKEALVIASTQVTPFARQVMLQMRQEDFHLELFREAELLVNITEHIFVPKHQLLSDEEKKQVLSK